MPTEKDELRERVKAEKKRIEARLHEAKADAFAGSKEKKEELRQKLNELQQILKDGWDNLTEEIAGKLNEWLKSEEKQMS